MTVKFAAPGGSDRPGNPPRGGSGVITFLVSDLNRNPLGRLIRRTRGRLPRMRILTYDRAFRRLWVPRGTLVFTDFDLLTDFELDAACSIAAAARDAGPEVRVLNDPRFALERAAMHRHLSALGLNPVEVTRVEDEVPRRYPVFIRLQGGCERPDTGLLHDEAAFRAARSALVEAGRPLRGRIAVSFEADPDAQGFYRKYGAFRIGGAIVPQHILRGPHWYVKRAGSGEDADFAAEELAYIRDNPHRERLLELFEAAGHRFGRADYTLRDGRPVLFEINSNPSFPNLTRAWRGGSERHLLLLERLDRAFRSIDCGDGGGRLRFGLNMAIGHNVSRRRWHPVTTALWKRRLAPKDARATVAPEAGSEAGHG